MTELRIAVKNLTSDGGLYTTPVWLGFNDGAFDTFDSGQAASAGLESLAEDGNAAGLSAELTAADADAQSTSVTGTAGIIAPGETTSTFINVDGASNGFLNYAAMILPSNDAFVGNDDALRLFSASGRFLGEQNITLYGTDVYDAGTEVNTEIPTDVPLLGQTVPNTGPDENGVVGQHKGFNGSLGNPIGTGEHNILGGTNALGEFIDPDAADFTQDDFELLELHINTVKRIEGGNGKDRILGGDSDDFINAGAGNDVVHGRDGWDVIDGGSGRDLLSGGKGDDELYGGAGNDKLFGGRDDDILNGGTGNDRLFGGQGDDIFVFTENSGRDRVQDFQDGHDRIAIDIAGFDSVDDVFAAAKQKGHTTYIDFGDGNVAELKGVDLASLDTNDFLFA